MGYSLHVIRGSGAYADDIEPIAEADWRAALEAHGDFVRVDELVGTNPATGKKISVPGPHDLWTGHSSGARIPVRFSDGQGSLGYDGDKEHLALLLALARLLRARVFGDEGEEYKG